MTDETNVTLRKGLELFYTEYNQHLSHEQPGISQEARNFFQSHDVAHVVFGCDISLLGEGAVKIWTIFGTTCGFWEHIKGYRSADALGLSQNFSIAHIANNIFGLLISIPKTIIRAKRMKKPWPWKDFTSYLDSPISEIRKEFNIQVLT